MGWGARFAGFVTVVGLVVAASGCGTGAGPEPQLLPVATEGPVAGPEGGASPTPSGSAEASPTPATAAASPEPAASKHTPEGAEAFVRHWIAVANEAFTTGNTTAWRALNTPSCRSCAVRIDTVEAAYGPGGRIEGGQLRFKYVTATPIDPGSVPLVIVDFDVTPEIRFDASGQERFRDRGGRTKLVFFMQWDRPDWRVAEIKVGVKQ